MKKEQPESALQMRRRTSESTRHKLSAFAGALLKEWKRLGLPARDERVVVAVSGGADSVALLLALCEMVRAGRLDVKITAAHLDHGLRGAVGAEDARWVKALAEEFSLDFKIGRAEVKKLAAVSRDNLEQAARRARYEFLIKAARKVGARVIVIAHTMDDQAETVLMRLMRGSGAEGLSGMEAVSAFEDKGELSLVRPLLNWARRADTEEYCRERGVRFRVDEMNSDENFTRVRVRRQLLPLMQKFNPRVVETISRTASLLSEDASALNASAAELLRRASEEAENSSKPPALSVQILRAAPAAVRTRALRQWIARARGHLRRLELVHLLAVDGLLEGERGGRMIVLPGGLKISRRKQRLELHTEKG